MRDRAKIYDDLLQVQARVTFPLEHPLYQFKIWEQSRKVLDLGCGNAFYAKMLLDDYPDKVFICVEKDEAMASIARERYKGIGLEVITGSYDALSGDFEFDFLLLRHVTSYLPDRKAFFKWVKEHAASTAGILIIDADDEHFLIKPNLPIFLGGLGKFREKVNKDGGQRDVRKDIQGELAEIGFRHIETQRIIANSKIPNTKELTHLYMCLVAELDIGSPLPQELAAELYLWALDPRSYIQYGLFGSLFVMNYDNVEDKRIFQEV